MVVDIFTVLLSVVLGLVHKPSTFSPMANLFPGFSSLQQVQLHCGRNCLNPFQTTADADPAVPRMCRWSKKAKSCKHSLWTMRNSKICISRSTIHPKLSKIKNMKKYIKILPKNYIKKLIFQFKNSHLLVKNSPTFGLWFFFLNFECFSVMFFF